MKTIGIIGGGIAGLALSIDLAQRGFKVTVFEKNTYPNHKVCGEYVSAECSPYLDSLGVLAAITDCPRINQLQVSSPKGTVFNSPMMVGGIGISRYRFDNELYQRALHLNVQFVFAEVTDASEHDIITKTGHKANFELVLGAFGKRSNLDVKWQRSFTQKAKNSLNQWVGIKYHIKYDGIDDKTIALHNFEYGYCGISKVEDGITCLCYLVSSRMLKGRSIPELEQEVLNSNPHLKDIFTNATHLYEKPLAISQVSFDAKETLKNGIPFIGDAAGLITPLCGNGMSLALRSAKLMAEEIAHGKKDYYQQHWKKEIAPRLWWGRLIQSSFGNKTITEILVRTCKMLPGLGRFLVSKSHGKEF